MFAATPETKVLRDPIHGYIHIDYEVIWQLLNTSWFQRLRRIRQLGGAYMVYHCAEHSRFGHSLGTYEVVRRMVAEVPDLKEALTEKEKITVMAAALLHDVGHGPYSHAFESISHISHEEVTCRVITGDKEIRTILNGAAKGLAKDVADVIRHKSENKLLPQLISSQLDADRMDYLLRDAYFTGTAYGEYDLDRILRTLRVDHDRLVVKESGVYAVENYIMARYHMYWQVYYHPSARAYECLLRGLFNRLWDLEDPCEECVIPEFMPLVRQEKLTIEQYFALDDNTCSYGFAKLRKHPDHIVKDFATRLLDRRLFQYADSTAQTCTQVADMLVKNGYDLKYYLQSDEVRQRPYVPYNGHAGSVFVKMEDGSVRELSNASNIVYSLIHGPGRDEKKIFYPVD